MTSENLEQAVQSIIERNSRVEAEKAWEVSLCRRVFILGITYAVASLFLWMLDQPKFYLEALIPTGGYLFSTFSLSWIKAWWMRGYRKKRIGL